MSWRKRLTHCKYGHEYTPENTRYARVRGQVVGRVCVCCANAASVRWKKNNPAKALRIIANNQLIQKYGIGLKDRDATLAAQDGKCFVCREAETEDRRLHVDHDHLTGRVRALLCANCNLCLGHAKDSPTLLELLAAYLRRFSGDTP